MHTKTQLFVIENYNRQNDIEQIRGNRNAAFVENPVVFSRRVFA
jgi:hypothetical protein